MRKTNSPPPADIDGAADSLIWMHSPFRNIEESIELGDIKVADEFGNEDARFRVLSCKKLSLLNPESPSNDDRLMDARAEFIRNLDKFEEVLLFQTKNANGQWRDVDLPGSALQLFAAHELFAGDTLNSNAMNRPLASVYSELIGAIFDPGVPVERANDIKAQYLSDSGKNYVNFLTNWLVQKGANFQSIPESISPEPLMKLYLAGYLSAQFSERELNTLLRSAEKGNASHAVFLPKLPEEAKKAKEVFVEGFKEIPPKPRVFYARLKMLAEYRKILVMHDPANKRDLFNYGLLVPMEREELKPLESWRKVPDEEATQIQQFFNVANAGWLGAELLELHELSQDEIAWVAIPNKVRGLGKLRIAPGVTYNNPDGNEKRVLLFDEKMRDIIIPEQSQIQKNENWITTLPKLETFWKKGIRYVYGLGALSPIEALSRYLKGSIDPYNLNLNLAHMPDNPYLLYVWAAVGMESVLYDQFDSETNMAVSLSDLPIHVITATNVQTIGEVFGADDQIEVKRCIFDGKEVNLEAGAFLPIKEILEIGGVKYLLFRAIRDDQGGLIRGKLEQLWNDIGFDKINSALAIRLEDAVNGGVMPLDFDDNILKAIRDIVRIVLITSSIVTLVAAPELTGALVTASGKAIQSRLLNVTYSLPLILKR